MDSSIFRNLLSQLDKVSLNGAPYLAISFTIYSPSFAHCTLSALLRRQESFSDGKRSAIRSYLQYWFSGKQVEAVLKKLTFPSDQTEVLEMISPVRRHLAAAILFV